MDRKKYIDAAKLIGLLCIFLAHVSPHAIVAQFRNFDVPLMVIISGVLASDAYQKVMQRKEHGFRYVRKRFIRLVLTVWIFLVPFVTIRYVFSGDLTANKILNSFLLGRDSIGYVWIIMVYLICALLTPLLWRINVFSFKHLVPVVGVYVLYEVVCSLHITTTIDAIDDILFYVVPYGCLTLFGMNYEKLSKKTRFWSAVGAFAVFVGMAWGLYVYNGSFVYTQTWKYPARIYYLSYAVAMSMVVLELLRRAPSKLLNNALIAFVSKHSLWIYLWHILMLWVVPAFIWPVRFVVVFAASCTMAFFQEKVVLFLEKRSFPKILLIGFKG